MKMRRFDKLIADKVKKNKTLLVRCLIWITIAIVFLAIIQVLFTIPAPNRWLDAVWDANGFIIFIGTIALGFVAIYQNIKANKLNKNMQKLEEAKFVSMISMTDFSTNYSKGKFLTHRTDYKNAEHIDLADIDDNAKRIKIYIEFDNNSDFPIVSISAIAGKASEYAQKYLCVKHVLDKPIYIPVRTSVKFYFSMPYEHIIELSKTYENNTMPLTLMLSFENIFSYRTQAFLYMEINENEITGKYRLVKFTDVKPDNNVF